MSLKFVQRDGSSYLSYEVAEDGVEISVDQAKAAAFIDIGRSIRGASYEIERIADAFSAFDLLVEKLGRSIEVGDGSSIELAGDGVERGLDSVSKSLDGLKDALSKAG